MRTVPAGGALHPFETYLIVSRVEGLQPGVYRYLALEHKLLCLSRGGADFSERVNEAIPGGVVSNAAVLFIWTTIPYRKEWRYSIIAFKDILIDAGHVYQNLYLSCEAIGAGTCALLSYDQKKTDAIIGWMERMNSPSTLRLLARFRTREDSSERIRIYSNYDLEIVDVKKYHSVEDKTI